MPNLLSRYATPFITGLFLVSLVSGVALFFHVGSSYFHGMHEWLSIVLILPFVLHVWKNWRAFQGYFKRPAMGAALGVSALAALVFVVPTGGEGGANPQIALVQAVGNGTVAELAPLFGHTPESLSTALAGRGYKVETAEATIADIATASGKSARDAVMTLATLKQ